jgi:hypothetical protein
MMILGLAVIVINRRHRGLSVISAAVAFSSGGHKAAAIIATQALLVCCLTYTAAKRDRARRA